VSTFTHDRIGGTNRTTCDDCGENFTAQWGPTILRFEREHTCRTERAA